MNQNEHSDKPAWPTSWFVRSNSISHSNSGENVAAIRSARNPDAPQKIHTLACQHCGNTTEAWSDRPPRYCGHCAMPSDQLQSIFDAALAHTVETTLPGPTRQFGKHEYEAAARTSLVLVEERLRKLTGLPDHGADLVAKAFSYTYDSAGHVSTKPLIRINDLATTEQRNEHEGVKLLCLGVFRGLRNIIAHHETQLPPKSSLSILLLADLLIDLISDGSVLTERVCLWTRVSEPTK